MDKKYMFFDIDGTLTVYETGEIIPSVYETIKRLQDNGHFVSICSGRAYYKVLDFAKKVGITNIVANGGAAIAIDGKLIENRPIDRDKALALINQAKALGFGILVAFDDSIRVLMNDDLFIKQVGPRQEPTDYIYDKNFDFNKLKNIYKVYVAIDKEHEHLLTTKDDLGYIRFVDGYLTFQHDSKDKGIDRMLEIVGGDKSKVVVFGDDKNDLVMFNRGWFSIAMGSGNELLKSKASFVTKNSKDDGIKYACEHFGWI